jgi:hypothetical protein
MNTLKASVLQEHYRKGSLVIYKGKLHDLGTREARDKNI